MNGGKAPLTSEQQMNMFRWRDKMTLLNSEFMQVFKHFYEEKQHYDFTGTMESYKEHVQQLRNMYNMPDGPETEVIPAKKVEKPKEVAQSTPAPVSSSGVQRKIAKATRRNAGDTPKVMNSTVIESTSPMKAPPAPKFGDISVIAKDTPAPLSKGLTKPTIPDEPAPTARKRAIRGGGPLGGSESVVFKSAGGEEQKTTSSTTKIPEVTIKFPEPTKDFWTKKDDSKADGGSLFAFLGKDNDKSSKFTGFSFGKKPNESTEKSPESATKSSSLFGSKPAEISPMKPFSFGTKLDEPAKPLSFGGATKSPEPTKPLSFGGNKPAESAKPLSFGGPKTAETSPSKPTSSLFGNSTSTLSFGGSTSGAPTLSFGSSGLFAGLAQKAMENKEKEKEGDQQNNEEEGEYVPPKAETVENEEPDAVLSSKVSVFKFSGKEYSKLGVGMLHIKSADSKHSLLIRAATTTGTVWLNALCNAAMKATKIDEKGDRIRLTCPVSMSEMTTMMIRFGTAEGAKKFLDKIEEVSK